MEKDNDDYLYEIMHNNVIDNLISMCKDPNMSMSVMWLFYHMLTRINSNLVKSSRSWADLDNSFSFKNVYVYFIDSNISADVIDLIKNEKIAKHEDELRKLVIMFIDEILNFCIETGQTKAFVTNQLIEKAFIDLLIDCIKDNKPSELIYESLKVIYKLLCVGVNEENDQNNQIAIEFQERDGTDSLEDLVNSHPNESIYKASVDIIEKFYS